MEVQNAGMSIELIFACIFFVLGVISVIWMIISIFKTGDERKEIIILKASHWTFIETVGILFINLFYYIGLKEEQVGGVNLFVLLSIIGILYLINLLIFKKRYGD